MQLLGEAPFEKCPSCAGPQQWIVSIATLILKGGGWYKDGYSPGEALAETEKKDFPKTGGKGPLKNRSGRKPRRGVFRASVGADPEWK